MRPQRLLLGWVLGATAVSAAAQSDPVLRWRDAADPGLGLRPGQLSLGVGEVQASPIDRILGRVQAPGLDLRRTTRNGEPSPLGIYGRFGSVEGPPSAAFGPAGGLTYGVGLRWNLSPRFSAVLGWDSYDLRTAVGERDMRATSLGLQFRY